MNNYQSDKFKLKKNCNGRNLCKRKTEEDVSSSSERLSTRSNSNYEVQRQTTCTKSQASSTERSCSVSARPGTRRNPQVLPHHLVTPGKCSNVNLNCNAKKIMKQDSPTNRLGKQVQAKNPLPESHQKRCFRTPENSSPKITDNNNAKNMLIKSGKQSHVKNSLPGTSQKEYLYTDLCKKCPSIRSSISDSSKSPKVSMKIKHDLRQKECCANKDPLQKAPIPAPRVIKITSTEKSNSMSDYEYLQFALRITEDIIRNDLYSTKQIRQVFNSHVEANKGRLDMDKMLMQIEHLCKTLNLDKRNTNEFIDTCTCDTPKTEDVDSLDSPQDSLKNNIKKIMTGEYLTSNDEIGTPTEHDFEEEVPEILSNKIKEDVPYVLREMNQIDEMELDKNFNMIHNNVETYQNILCHNPIICVECDENETMKTVNKEANEVTDDKTNKVDKIDNVKLDENKISDVNLSEAIAAQSKTENSNSFETKSQMIISVLTDVLNELNIQVKCPGDETDMQSKDKKLMERKSVEEIINIIQYFSQIRFCCNLDIEQNVSETDPNVSSKSKNKNIDDTSKARVIKCSCIEESEVSIVEPQTSVVKLENKSVTFTDKTVQTEFVEEMFSCKFSKKCQQQQRLCYCASVKHEASQCGEQWIDTNIPLISFNEPVYEEDNRVESKDQKDKSTSIDIYILKPTSDLVDIKKPQEAQEQNEMENRSHSTIRILESESPVLRRTISQLNLLQTSKQNCNGDCTYDENKQTNNKSEFVSKIEGIITASTKNLYQYTDPSTCNHETILVCPLCRNYYNKSNDRPVHSGKQNNITSSLEETSSEGEVSESYEDSSSFRKVEKEVMKKGPSEILERLKKYERNIKNSHKENACLSDCEMINCDESYKYFTPRFSRSLFFPSVSTQTSNSYLQNIRECNSLLSDGEIQNTSSESTDKT